MKRKAQTGSRIPKPGEDTSGLPKGAKAIKQTDRRPKFIQSVDSTLRAKKQEYDESQKNVSNKKALKNIYNAAKGSIGLKNGGKIKKK